jgi:DNA primase
VAPGELDPCDLRLQRGDEAVRKLIGDRKPMFEFMIKRQLAGHNLETVEGRVAALRAAAPVVAGIRDPALVDGYVRNLAGWLGLDPREVNRAVTSNRNTASRRPSHTEPGPSREGDRQGGSPAGAATNDPPRREISLTELPTDPVTRSERDALMAILQYPKAVGPELVTRATRVRFSNSTLAVIRDAVAASASSSPDAIDSPEWLQRVAAQVPAEFSTLVTQLGVAPIPERPEQLALYCEGVVTSLIDRDILRQKAEVLGAMQRASAEGDQERWATLNRESAALETERRALRKE